MTNGPHKRLFIKTYGCQMNAYDSARMADVLAPLGYLRVDAAEEADLVLLNTCHIREKAAEKVYSELGRIREMRDERRAAGGDVLVAVAGCVAQAEGEEIMRRAPVVDIVIGPQTYHRLPELVVRAETGRGRERRGIATDFPAESKFDFLPEESAPQGPAAFLTVQEGCDKFCTFCVVPYTRGAEASRPAADVLAEARRLIAQGTREITLLGQNVNAYHGDGPGGGTWGLGRLIRELADLPGMERIRYTTSHPRDMDDELIAAHGEVPALMPYLHLPVQSGADGILERMNRGHTAADYLRIVDRLRAARSDLALSSDFIVGFPGETDDDFRATLDLIERIEFAQAYSFKYSGRPGTPAAGARGQLRETVKTERLAELQELLSRQQAAFNAAMVGRATTVLFDRPGRHPGQLVGRSPWLQAVHADVPASAMGRILPVRIEAAGPRGLAAVVTDPDGDRSVEAAA